MSSEDLVAYLRARLDEEEAIARAASRPYRYADDGSKAPGTGVHWRWVTGGRWLTTEPDPVVQEFVADGDDVNLATVEEWPSTTRLDDGAVIHTRMMPETYAHSIVEMDAAAGLHIARHDPARVLADIEAKRRLIDLHVNQGSENLPACKVCDVGFNACGCVGWDEWPCETLKILVQPYSSRPDFNEDWRTP